MNNQTQKTKPQGFTLKAKGDRPASVQPETSAALTKARDEAIALGLDAEKVKARIAHLEREGYTEQEIVGILPKWAKRQTESTTAPTSSKHQANVDKASQLAIQSTESVKGSVGGEIQAIAKELQAAAAKDSQLVEQASDFLAGLQVTRRARILEATQRKIQSASVVEPEAEVIETQGFTSLFDDDLVIDVDWENLVFTSQPQLSAGAQ